MKIGAQVDFELVKGEKGEEWWNIKASGNSATASRNAPFPCPYRQTCGERRCERAPVWKYDPRFRFEQVFVRKYQLVSTGMTTPPVWRPCPGCDVRSAVLTADPEPFFDDHEHEEYEPALVSVTAFCAGNFSPNKPAPTGPGGPTGTP